nr:T9SS type A sorting domain-containing protein [Bacteroidota bacterium]
MKQKTEIDLEKIKQGIYFVMLSGGNDIFTGKIIKM